MGNVRRNFIKGRMNKSVDERLVPNGEYIDALNVRLGSTEGSEIGSVENSKGNTRLTTLQYQGVDLSDSARCLGAFEDGVNETVYWFIHDSANTASATGVVDIIASFRTTDEVLTYHVISTSVLNFNPTFLITGVDKVEDLLFFTDDYNPPRKINVVENYPQPISATDVDQITNDDINVIKRPPNAAPTLTLIDIPGEEDYLESHFVSFSYRYKYVNNDYSALSQFTDVAFESSPFSLDPATNFNDGMLNRYNTAVVGINTGGEDVVGIDLCFKLGTDSTVRVIQKYIKSEEGWPNNVVQTVNFTNQKIYTLLPQSEIARLYDNVPLKAQAQTIMGNRLMYGNYVDGYDLTIASGARINTNYSAEVVSENLSVFQAAGDVVDGDDYTIDPENTVSSINTASIIFDSPPVLAQGGVFGFSFTVTHASFSGDGQDEEAITVNHPTFTISFVFNLPQGYGNVYEMVTSPEFQSQLGANGSGTYQSLANCADGSTFTDVFNCSLTAPSGYTLVNSGITALSQGVFIDVSPSNLDEFGVTVLGVQYSRTENGNNQYFEYFRVSNVSYSLQLQASNKSLHSNRDYEVGVVYMDEYKRSTTALTSNENAVFVPPANSGDINKIQVTIPTNMTAPSWAKTYKFVLKQSKGAYETIYSTLYYYDTQTQSYWIRLVGQDQALVEAGTELIVKRDSNGTLNQSVKAVVLDKVSQPTNFLQILQDLDIVTQVPGLYIRVKALGFSIDTTVSSFSPAVDWPGGEVVSDVVNGSGLPNSTQQATTYNNFATVNYPCYTGNATDGYSRVPILSGSIVTIKIKFNRSDAGGLSCGNENGASLCRVEKSITASQDYVDIKAFWDGEGLGSVLINAMNCEVDCQYGGGPNTNTYYPGVYSVNSNTASTIVSFTPLNNQIFFYSIANDSGPESSKRLYLRCQNGSAGNAQQFPLNDHPSITKVRIQIQEPGSLIVFETEPNEVADDIFYEGSENYAITGGYHQGNVTNQDATTEGVVDLDFFNCYAFGNGVESYKIEDSAVGESFQLGHRAVLVAAQDFKEADRFADITYSGIYNDESNVNKLNEFNLGLLNFKPLEDVYGPIQKMVARETDILVLQEDRISYVVVNKNVLTDAQGGSVLTAAPVILGQQVARVEEYGVSANPESYAEFGFDKYFTDAKRGAVIQLRGTSASNETLTVISKAGMRSWFRDLFNESFTTQKLGGFDPYMDEYVLASNDILLPVEAKCINCGIAQTISLSQAGSTNSFCVNVGSTVGDIEITWGSPFLIAGVTFDVVATFGTTYSASNQTGAGSLTIPKTGLLPNTVSVVITANGGAIDGLPITVECPDANEINVIMVSLNRDWQNTETIHSEFRFVDGTTLSPTYSEFVEFDAGTNPVVSQYQLLTGAQGSSVFPPQGATVYVQSAKLAGDVFNFLPAENSLKHWRTTQLYPNTPANIQTILSNSTDLTVTPNTDGASLYSGNFTFNGSGDYLYLVYDYREANPSQLCYGVKSSEACCCDTPSTFYLDAGSLSTSTTVYSDAALTVPAADGWYQAIVFGNSIVRNQLLGVLGSVQSCASCVEDCRDVSLPPVSVTLTENSFYDITYDLGNSVGVSAIKFSPDIAGGIFVTYDGVTKSDSSSVSLINSTLNPATSWFPGPYYGDTSTAGIPATGTAQKSKYNWNYVDQDFDADGVEPITIAAGDLTSLTNGNAGDYILYVSKPTTTLTTLTVRIISPLATAPDWAITVECPVRLSAFSSSVVQATVTDICIQPFTVNLFNLPVKTTSSPGVPTRGDWVFADVLGETLASEGYYRVSGNYIRVDANGVIVEKIICT